MSSIFKQRNFSEFLRVKQRSSKMTCLELKTEQNLHMMDVILVACS